MGGEAALAASSCGPHLGASARAHPRTPARGRLRAQAMAAVTHLGPFSRRLGPSPQGWRTSGKSPLRIAQVYGPGNKMPEVLGDMLKSVRARVEGLKKPNAMGVTKTGLEARCSPGRPKPTTPLNGGSFLGRT